MHIGPSCQSHVGLAPALRPSHVLLRHKYSIRPMRDTLNQDTTYFSLNNPVGNMDHFQKLRPVGE